METNKFQLNIRNIFPPTLRNFPEQEIAYANLKKFTFSEFYNRVSRIASALVKIGVRPGDKVAVLDWDTNHYMESYFAIPMTGAIMHTVNIRYPPELIFYTMQHAEDKYVIIRDEFVPIIEKAVQLFDFIKGWIIYSDVDENIKTVLTPTYHYEEMLAQSEPYEFSDVDEESIATIFYTSGTTGLPKGVTFSHRNLVLHAEALAMAVHMEPLYVNDKDVFMSLVPMFHVHSWGLPYVTMITGNKYVLPGRYEVKNILETIKNNHVTLTLMVPSILYMILTYPELESYAKYLNGWKVVIGGAALPKGLAKKAESLGINAIGGYGLSETCPVLSIALFTNKIKNMSDDDKFEYKISTGIPIPFVNIRVADSAYKDVPWNNQSIGEIIVRAPWLTNEYYKDPEKTKELWRDGWLHTGDLAMVDDKGYIHIVDREKDAVKSGGEFIPSLILENVISECKNVGEVAVVGAKSEKWGERPVAFVTATGQLRIEDVFDHLDKYVNVGRIQKWWIPDKIIIIMNMPKTSTGKIDKKELKAQYKL